MFSGRSYYNVKEHTKQIDQPDCLVHAENYLNSDYDCAVDYDDLMAAEELH